MWHDGEARILGSELATWSVSSVPGSASASAHPTAIAAPVITPVSAAGAGAAIATGGVPAASFASGATALTTPGTARRYEIVSSNFRLASKKLDGYDAWANQVWLAFG